MSRRIMCLGVSLVVVVLMATQVLAQDYWTNGTHDGKWSTGANWSLNVHPIMDPSNYGRAVIDLTGDNACRLDGTMPHAQCQWLHVGEAANGTLNVVAGGTIGGLGTVGDSNWGPGEAFISANGLGGAGGLGTVNIDGVGSIACSEGWRLGGSTSGSAVINITNGGEMIGGWWFNAIHSNATVNLINGTMLMYTLAVDIGGLIDIHPGGTLFLSGDKLTYANELIDTSRILGNGVYRDVAASFDGNNTIVVCQVSGADRWTNGTTDGKWSTAANWSNGRVPVVVEDGNGMAKISLSDANACVIDGTQPEAVCQWLYVGFAGPGTLNIVSGGKLGTPTWGPGETFLGGHSAGVVNVDGAGSVAQSEGWRIGSDIGSGTLNITNGGSAVAGWWGTNIHSNGRINIISGDMFIWGNPSSLPGSELTIDAGGLINISLGGTLTLNGDQRTLINGYVADGKILGNGLIGAVAATFDGTNTLVVYHRDLSGQQLMLLKKGVTFDRQFHQIPVESYNVIHTADVNLVKTMGLNFAKLIFNPYHLIKGSTIDDANMWYVDELVNKFVNRGIPVVVCIHPEADFKNYYLGNGGAHFPALLGFYQDFAAYLAARWGRGDVAFELMTEPYGNYTSWNTMLPQMWQAARNGMPNNILILDADGTGDIGHLTALNPVPPMSNDPNIYYSFTTYWPWTFTFQGNWWSGSYYPYLVNVPYPSTGEEIAGDYVLDIPEEIDPDGTLHDAAVAAVTAYLDTPWNYSQHQALFAPITAWRNAHGNPKVFCAEWGVLDANQARKVLSPSKPGAVEADRVKFIKDRRLALEDANISWAYWSFNEAFTLLDPIVRVANAAGPTISWLDNPTLDALGLPLCGCGCKVQPDDARDLNHDCYINILDLAMMAGGWLDCTATTDANCL